MKKSNIEIAPSILAGDFSRLAEEVQRVEAAGADCLHVDVMDGHFVPNLTFGPQVVAAMKRSSDLFLDVHLMMYNPYDWVERFIEAGADRITFHFEATEDVGDTLQFIRRCGKQAGLAFCPETSADMLEKHVDQCDLLLLMTVSPGFGGQAFKEEVLDKIRYARHVCQQRGVDQTGKQLTIQVDGGINDETAALCVEAGANSLVAGTHLFGQPDLTQAISKLRQAAEAAVTA